MDVRVTFDIRHPLGVIFLYTCVCVRVCVISLCVCVCARARAYHAVYACMGSTA